MVAKIFLSLLLLPAIGFAYEPQFAIPDLAVDQNFKNVAAEIKDTKSTLAAAAQLASTPQLASTQTFTGSNTFNNSTTVSSFTVTGNSIFSGATSTATFSGWVDFGLYISTHTGTGGGARAGCGAYRAISCNCDTAGEFLQAQILVTEGDNSASSGTLATGTDMPHGCGCDISTSAGVVAQAVCARIK